MYVNFIRKSFSSLTSASSPCINRSKIKIYTVKTTNSYFLFNETLVISGFNNELEFGRGDIQLYFISQIYTKHECTILEWVDPPPKIYKNIFKKTKKNKHTDKPILELRSDDC